jgi:hypothetical protein
MKINKRDIGRAIKPYQLFSSAEVFKCHNEEILRELNSTFYYGLFIIAIEFLLGLCIGNGFSDIFFTFYNTFYNCLISNVSSYFRRFN